MTLLKNLQRHKTFTNVGLILFIYVGIGVMAYAAESVGGKGLLLLTLFLIAAMQVHLQILHHEAAHFNLMSNKSLNDFLSDIFLSLPFLGFTNHYRYFHLEHHRNLLNEDKDPEIDFYRQQGYTFFPQTYPQKIKMWTLDFCGYHYFQFIFAYNYYLLTSKNKRLRLKWPNYIALIVVVLSAVLMHKYFLLYWLLPQSTLQFGFLKLQGYGEHSKRKGGIEDCTYNQRPGLIRRFFIYPLNSHLHLTHHLHPNLAWFELGKATKLCYIKGLKIE